MEYYPALKRKGILACAATWMNLEDLTLWEADRAHARSYCKIPLIWKMGSGKLFF